MKISEAARIAQCTVRTIRHYHQIGLLPTPPRQGAWRDYSIEDVATLVRIRTLVHAGISLDQVKEQLNEPSATTLDEALRTIDQQIATLEQQRRALLTLRDQEANSSTNPIDHITAVYDAIEKEVRALGDPRALSIARRERFLTEALGRTGLLCIRMGSIFDVLDAPAIARYYVGLGKLQEPGWTKEEVDDLLRQGFILFEQYEPFEPSVEKLIQSFVHNDMLVRLCLAAFPQPGYEYLLSQFQEELKRRYPRES